MPLLLRLKLILVSDSNGQYFSLALFVLDFEILFDRDSVLLLAESAVL